MLQITPQMRILVALEAVDGRKGVDGLAEVRHDKAEEWAKSFRISSGNS